MLYPLSHGGSMRHVRLYLYRATVLAAADS